ncbi:MAG: HAD family phosphatase [Clostridiales bacterium]|nr:HAD family phosphatase [Clostridiales bacterium]
MKQDFKAVVFDMDGVIFDSEKLVVLCWQEIADKYNIIGIEEQCRLCLGLNREAARQKMLEHYGMDFPYDTYKKEMSDLYHRRYSGGRLPMKPGVVELLTFLKEKGKKIALASSTRREVVLAELRDAGILDYFDKVICGDMVKRSKPEPDIFLKACEELEVEVQDAYAIEDSYNGIRAAYRAGMMPIMVPDLAEPTEEMKQLTVAIMPSLLEMLEWIDKM